MQMEVDGIRGHRHQLNRKSQGYGLSGPTCDLAVTTARKREEDEHQRVGGGGGDRREDDKQLKMKPVVVLRRLAIMEIEEEGKTAESTQTAQPQERLPPEIITMILGYLKDPTDLQNCSRANPILSDILSPRKPEYLFEQVLPHLLGYLSFGDLKNGRLVCKEWNRGVNELIENRPCVRPYNDEIFLKEMGNLQTRQNFGATPHSKLWPVTRIRTDVTSLETFTATYNSLNFGDRNPFLGGAVELLVEPTPDILDNIDENIVAMVVALNLHVRVLARFLFEFGHHIQHLRVKSHQIAPLVEARVLNYALLSLRLRYCPNLKSISIDMSHQENINPNGRDFMLVGEAATLLGGHRPLPELHTIEVKVTPAIRIPSFVMNALVTPYWDQLEKLSIPRLFSYRPNPYSQVFQVRILIKNLNELCIGRIRSNEILERLSGVVGPLQKLVLKFRYGDVNLSTLMHELDHFPLRHLELYWAPGIHPNIPAPGLTEDLPKIPFVHTLKMTNSVEVDYSFLRCFTNLKHLYLHEQVPANGPPLHSRPSVRVMKKIASSEDVQIHKYLYGGQMNRSNIWKIFPNLEVVVFERVRMIEGAPAETWKLTWGRRENRRRAQN